MMEVELKKHRWGERAIVTMDDGSVVEVMRFDSAGTDHKHEVDEFAECIRGRGFIYTDDLESHPNGYFGVQASPHGFPTRIPAGVMHHMDPDRYKDEPFEFIIRYAT